MCITHTAMHDIFNDPASYELPYTPGHGRSRCAGREGVGHHAVRRWGYAHLYDAKTSAKLDDFVIPEAVDERYSSGFGDLSIHEFATDPTTNLAYSAYYSVVCGSCASAARTGWRRSGSSSTRTAATSGRRALHRQGGNR
jgi:hypothetical protein